ncbi:MAG: DUF4250 domain-containing protein [Muribaculaceae bacterium]|nr:DUF4250 domain-containing protein [Muribaculaceae bacterium]
MNNLLPSDPFILMSFINTKLRDRYQSLSELCDDLGIDASLITEQLKEIGMEYDSKLNKFW